MFQDETKKRLVWICDKISNTCRASITHNKGGWLDHTQFACTCTRYAKACSFVRKLQNLHKKCSTRTLQKHANDSLVLLARFAHAYLFNSLLLKRIKHELLEWNYWTVHMHATNCIVNLRHRNRRQKRCLSYFETVRTTQFQNMVVRSTQS